MTVLRIKTSDKKTYSSFLTEDEVVISDIYGYEENISIGAPVFLSFGGNGKTDWIKGLAGICTVNSEPFDVGYKTTERDENYYRIKIKIVYRFNKIIEKKDLMFYPNSFDTGIGPSTKGERNQALGIIEDTKGLESICRAIIDRENETESVLIQLFGQSLINDAKTNVDILTYKTTNIPNNEDLRNLDRMENSEFAKALIGIFQTNSNITPEIIENLQDKTYCSQCLKTYFPILLKIDPEMDSDTLKNLAKYGTDKQKYYYEKYNINDSYYLITNDWYRTKSKNVQRVIEWLKQFYNAEIELKNKTYFSLDKFSEIAKRYIKSLLAKPFTILTGNSGTGKTKIATDFATFLGKIDQSNPKTIDGKDNIVNKLIVPVGADWTDNTKILGFYNPLEHKYHSTSILDFILLAKKNPNIPFFLMLDEMNLSYVERYFSDFLSAMESGEPIPLYKINAEDNASIPESIILPDNLFVTGTVNIDETTYMFSPKVLDRANVIEFIPDPKDVINDFVEESSKDEILPVDDGSSEGFLDLSRAVRKTNKISEEANITKDILDSIITILSNSDFEFAFRTAKEIRLYINAAEYLAKNASKTLEEKDYINLIDEQLVQKILPKIHGNRNQIGLLLKNLYEFCNSKTVKITDAETGTEKEVSGYALELSRKKIARMQRKLENSQFASFI